MRKKRKNNRMVFHYVCSFCYHSFHIYFIDLICISKRKRMHQINHFLIQSDQAKKKEGNYCNKKDIEHIFKIFKKTRQTFYENLTKTKEINEFFTGI